MPEPGHHSPPHRASDYFERGRRVEARFVNYSKRLADFHRCLAPMVNERSDGFAPLPLPEVIRHGYQVLPSLTSGVGRATILPVRSTAYSWPWTEGLIERELQSISRAQADLDRAKTLSGIERSRIVERLAREYRWMLERRRNIDAHIRYNQFWQAQIALDRDAYDRETAIFEAIEERQNIADKLTRFGLAYARASKNFYPSLWFRKTNNRLSQRMALLTRNIQRALSPVAKPNFVAIERRADEWIFRVSVYTDIDDQDFVSSIKRIIEAKWQVQAGQNTFRVELDISRVPTERLYRDMKKPHAEDEIDVLRHVRRFPPHGAIVTTGAATTHVQDYAIVLGPHPISAGVLAHEFGHLLGFRDRYVRGYRDLGRDGFQIMEVVSDPKDIMASPQNGAVLYEHFEALLADRREAPLRLISEHESFRARKSSALPLAAKIPSWAVNRSAFAIRGSAKQRRSRR